MDRGKDRLVLSARGLIKKYKELTAVGGIDLSLGRGECLALLGPNGAGKTTTVEMLEGLTEPDAGTIEVCGLSLKTARRKIMQRVGVLLQETTLYKRYTVQETLELFASFFDKSCDPQEIMRRLELTDKANTQLRKLSGGQRQRVYIGCTLINDPELLFLDEPTTGLDPQARRYIWDMLTEAKADGRSILLTTHYMEEAQYLADRVAIIDHGKIIAEGSPRALIQETCGNEAVWLSLEGEHNLDIVRQSFAKKLPWFAEALIIRNGLELTMANVTARIQDIFQAAAAMNFTIASLTMRQSTLEDVFLKLTGRSMRDG